MSSMTIKLDTDAVKALVFGEGATDEIRLKISSSIVQQFTKRYLKGVVSDEIVQTAVKDLKKAIALEVKESIGSVGYSSVKLHEDVKKAIKEAVKQALERHVRDAIGEALPEALENVPAIVKTQVNSQVANEVNRQFKAKMQAMKDSI